MAELSSRNVKKRYWTFVLYPDSAPEDWRDLLKKTGLPCAISPVHDKDVFEKDDFERGVHKGDLKKAHFHVLLCYSGPTTYNVVSSLIEGLNQHTPQPAESVRGLYRYLTHKDDPDKAQYDENAIETLNGFCITDFVELSKSEVTVIVRQLQQLIRDADIYEYSDFMDLLSDSDMLVEFEVASTHTYFFDRYIASRRNKTKNKAGDIS